METSCEKIYKLVKEWEINHIIIGLPRIFAEQSINKQIKNFGNKLKKKSDGTDIIFFDEDYSSNYAKSELLKQMQAGRKKKVNKEEIDRIAAAIILQSYFENEIFKRADTGTSSKN